MSDKKVKVLELLLCIVFMLIVVYFIHYYYTNINPVNRKMDNTIIKDDINRKLISDLKEKYNNDEVVMLFEVPNVIKIPICQTDDNKYYLKHDIYNDRNDNGSMFLDYRNKSFNDKKLIVYDKLNDSNVVLKNYLDSNFYLTNNKINLYTEQGIKTYEIFSVFNEKNDFDYTNLNSYNGLTYLEHINKLKSKSLFLNDMELNSSFKILVIDIVLNKEPKNDLVIVSKLVDSNRNNNTKK